MHSNESDTTDRGITETAGDKEAQQEDVTITGDKPLEKDFGDNGDKASQQQDRPAVAKTVQQQDNGPFGWVYEDGTYRGLDVGTKVVCTRSFYIGHVGCVVLIHEDGRVTYNFPTLSNLPVTYTVWEAKNKWRFAVVPPETNLWLRMTETETKRYFKIEKIVFRRKEHADMKMFKEFFPANELERRKAVEERWEKEDKRRTSEDARRLMEDTKGGDSETLSAWKARREAENIQRVLENGRRKTEEKQIKQLDELAFHRFPRKEILLNFLLDVSCLANLILDFEEAIQCWSNSLGWVFEDGKYKGLRPGSRVVCTLSFIGHVGYVSSILGDSKGTVTYYFPTYYKGIFEEVYTATQAIKTWGLCIVPDDTDLSMILSSEEAKSYLRATCE